MYSALLTTHGILRWVFLIFLVLGLISALSGWISPKPFNSLTGKFRVGTVILSHIQLLIGFTLYFISPLVSQFLSDPGGSMKVKELRYFGVEHMLLMLIATILITIGSAKSKRAVSDVSKYRLLAIFFGIAFVLILAGVPWFRPNFRAF
jgi:DNA helicase HerA-like ATPase